MAYSRNAGPTEGKNYDANQSTNVARGERERSQLQVSTRVGCVVKAATVTHNMTMSVSSFKSTGTKKTGYRRFADALKAALRLKDQFRDHNVKVRAIPAGNTLHK
jgi:hypothetical protein